MVGRRVASSPAQQHPAAVGGEEAGDQLQHRGLAAARRADQRDKLARRDGERDGLDPGARARIAERDVVKGDTHLATPLPKLVPRAASAPPAAAISASASRITVAAQAKPVAP